MSSSLLKVGKVASVEKGVAPSFNHQGPLWWYFSMVPYMISSTSKKKTFAGIRAENRLFEASLQLSNSLVICFICVIWKKVVGPVSDFCDEEAKV